uniref:Uncharacterized protein n=1 Tax=Arcella intermedia TaxID=1963864 RepID=A0A6B2KYK1_9EUKA
MQFNMEDNSFEGITLPDLLPGEKIKIYFPDEVKCLVYISNYALHIVPKESKRSTEERFYDSSRACIPLTCIHKAEKEEGEGNFYVDMILRDLREVRLTWNSVEHRAKFLQYLNFYVPKPEKLFANFHQVPRPDDSELPTHFKQFGYVHYNPTEEFNRIVKKNDQWKIIDWNEKYSICPTYPGILWVPGLIKELQISEVAKFRTKSRLPVLSWLHPKTQASLLRSSQPRRGMTGNNVEDQGYLDLLAKSGNQGQKLFIMDARAKVAAMANKAKGAGFEDAYQNSKVVFLNIDNIHGVRASWKSLIQICHKSYNISESSDVNWHSRLGDSGWLVHIFRIMRGAILTTEKLEEGYSVLVHCSDGWDRTAQLVSLTMLLCDSHYRTITGFEKLIEKEWLSFGHQFHTRHGYGGSTSEEAPIFLQFLECVYNFMRIFPTAFEFNEEFLIDIFDGSYSGAFCTFLYNSEKERKELLIWDKSPSLWHQLDKNPELYRNPSFIPTEARLLPRQLQMRHIYVWENLFFRWDPSFLNPKRILSGKPAIVNNTIEDGQEIVEQPTQDFLPAISKTSHSKSVIERPIGLKIKTSSEKQKKYIIPKIPNHPPPKPPQQFSLTEPSLVTVKSPEHPPPQPTTSISSSRGPATSVLLDMLPSSSADIDESEDNAVCAEEDTSTNGTKVNGSFFPTQPSLPSPNRKRALPITKRDVRKWNSPQLGQHERVSKDSQSQSHKSYGMTIQQLTELRSSLKSLLSEQQQQNQSDDELGDNEEANEDTEQQM